DPGYFVSGVLRRGLHPSLEMELQRDVADSLSAGAREGPETFDRAQLLLEDVGHGRLHHLGIGPRQHRGDRDNRRVYIRELSDSQLAVSDDSEEHQRQAEHAGQNRPADGHIRDFHGSNPTASDTELTRSEFILGRVENLHTTQMARRRFTAT